jgi:hypothetical protein
VGVHLNIIRKPEPAPVVAEKQPTHPLERDTRADPVGQASKEFMSASAPTLQMAKAAMEDFRPCLNRASYWMNYEEWWAMNQRHTLVRDKAEKGEWKAAKGLLKQLWDRYIDVMKNGSPNRRWVEKSV